ncbi:MAG: hypothetical protein ABIV25_08235 [Paracoccaceae bacterium]
MNPMWLLRMARWARRPPSMGRVKLVLVVVALCLMIVGIEHFWGWPASLRVNGRVRLPKG